MTIPITVPRLGWSMEEGTFCRWLKAEGEMVREGDELFELEGDKATQIVESFDAGVLRIAADGPNAGDIVKVGQVLGCLEPRASKARRLQPTSVQSRTGGTAIASAETAASPAIASPADAAAPVSTHAPATLIHSHAASKAPDGAVLASPSVRRLARKLNVDLQSIVTGPPHLLSAAEVLSSLGGANQSNYRSERRTPMHSGRPRAVTPRARRAARVLHVDPESIEGTGRHGRVRETDVRKAASSSAGSRSPLQQSESVVAGEPITPLRRVIAQRMMHASHETAPVTLTARADVTELVRFRDECKRTSAERGLQAPSYTALTVKLAAAALEKHPAVMGQWIDERIVKPQGIHIAVAVDTIHGLMTPVVHNVPSLSLRELSEELAKLIEQARERRLSAEQMQGGTFTVSSLGGYRVEAFTPILNPPQTAIVGVGRIAKQPVVREGQIAVGDVLSLSLTFDHRVVDGAPAAAFLTTLCDILENPLAWILT